MKRTSALILGLIVTLPARSIDPSPGPFLCVVEQVTGFRFDQVSHSWRQVNAAGGQKFILKRTLPQVVAGGAPAGGVWAVWDFPEDHQPHYFCPTELTPTGYLWCSGSVGEAFGINFSDHRFISDDLVGDLQAGRPKIVGSDSKPLVGGSNMPKIAIGTCTAL